MIVSVYFELKLRDYHVMDCWRDVPCSVEIMDRLSRETKTAGMPDGFGETVQACGDMMLRHIRNRKPAFGEIYGKIASGRTESYSVK
ncbi:MAG: hypothetical protein LUC90_09825 [Lachnospiraceae bacterium]|nr:hypothetical protein [Lachnospiraceae bacterium]